MSMLEADRWDDLFAFVDQAVAWARDVARLSRRDRRALRGDLVQALQDARRSGAAAGDVRVWLESRSEGHARFDVVALDSAGPVLH